MIIIRILSIISSGRKNGHSSKIVSLLEEELKQISVQNNDCIHFETIFLTDYVIEHCRGCRACMDYGEDACPIKDDIPAIKTKMKEFDAVIFASPVYVGDVSSVMKALIDRLAYICHRQEFYDKCAIIVATTNVTSLKRTIRTIGAATYSWGFKVIETKGFKTDTSNDSIEILQLKYLNKITKLARKLYSEVKEKSYLNPSALAIATFKIQQKFRSNQELSSLIDYNYWKKHGWTDSKRKYYIEIKVSFRKKIISSILCCLFSVFL
ncbi:MAG: flavodoxin family protein [Candidatus Hermodarchaeota archaeon]